MQWEYLIEVILVTSVEAHREQTEEKLDELGDDGWEAVSVWVEEPVTYVLLKRPK